MQPVSSIEVSLRVGLLCKHQESPDFDLFKELFIKSIREYNRIKQDPFKSAIVDSNKLNVGQ